jgi:molybdopterin-dependent oxidoreductase alpha subunit
MKDDPTLEGPIETGTPHLRPYEHAAGGLDAVTSSLGFTLRRAGAWRGGKALLRLNQEGGYDCPSCAWPDPKERAALEFCENGARAAADEATTRRAGPELFRQWSIAQLKEQPDVWLNAQGRLTHPMVKHRGATHYEPIGWDEAFALLAGELVALGDPDAAVFYTSGRTSNEAAFLYQLFVRHFGTNNLPDCSNMCHESSGTGLHEVIGVGKGTVQLEDFEQADLIFVIGQNPGTNHPRMLTTLRAAKQRGARIIAVNPLREAGLVRFQHPQHPVDWLSGGVALTDLFLQVRIGGDIALFKGLMKGLLEEELRQPGKVFDRDFIGKHTVGFAALVSSLDTFDWSVLETQSGVARSEMRQAARMTAEAKGVIACWAMGITQHQHGVANVQEIVNFMLLGGNLGKPGAGICPVRGHSNVQGDRTMGVWEKPPAWIEALERVAGFRAPRRHGLDTVGAIAAMREGTAKIFFGLGGNFVSASPDTRATAQAMQRCRVTAHVSTKLNRSHLTCGDIALILPCLGRSELDAPSGGAPQFVTVEDSMGVVHTSRGALAPASQHLLSEPQIVARLAVMTLGGSTKLDWHSLGTDYDRIRDLIAEVVPGFEDFNRRVRLPTGFVLPNAARERRWNTPVGAALFTVHPLPRLDTAPGQLVLTTVRTHDQFNTTVYDTNDRYRGIYGHRRVVMLHPDDMDERGLAEGQAVTLVSHFKGETRRASRFVAVPYDVPRGQAAAYFPEANVLVPADSYADKSRTPTSKAITITLEPE